MLRLRNKPKFQVGSNGFVDLFSLLFLIVIVLVFAVVVANRLAIQDWLKLRGYNPPVPVVQLADQDTMTAYTRHLFYLNKPQLPTTVAAFRQNCPEDATTIVLGCYHPDQNGIYIYDVQDQTLAGVTQVTAAHEVLHAVYARLSSQDRANLNNELQDYYKHGLTDQRVLAEVKLYQQTEPNSVMDEMSCTFGTEIANLPTGLNEYYKKYFNNRSAIVAFEAKYQDEFTSRQATIMADDQQLSTLKHQIDTQEELLTSQLDQINSQQAKLNRLRDSNSIDAYNAAVPGFNADVNAYNSGVANLHSLINDYNQLVATRNNIAADLTTLDKALDTRLTTQATQ